MKKNRILRFALAPMIVLACSAQEDVGTVTMDTDGPASLDEQQEFGQARQAVINPHDERYTVTTAPTVGANAILFSVGTPRDAQGDGYIGSVTLYRNDSLPTRTGVETSPDLAASVYFISSDFNDAASRISAVGPCATAAT